MSRVEHVTGGMEDEGRLRILFLAAGNSVHSIRWIRYFAERGHEVMWTSLAPFTLGVPPGVNAVVLSSGGSGIRAMLKAVLKVRRLVRDFEPDLLHAHYVGRYGILGALAGEQRFIVTAWGSDVLVAGRKPWLRPVIRFAMAKADAVTCDAYHMRDAIEGFGIERDRIHVICFGVDTGRYCPRPEFRLPERRRLGLEDEPVVISIRRLEPIYDIDTLLSAIPGVTSRVPGTVFLIVGEGSQRTRLERLALDLGIADSVRFLGRMSSEQLPRLFSSSDVYVSTSLSDGGLSSSTAEAMACGLPVVIANVGDNDRWVSHGESGLLFPASDQQSLAHFLVELLLAKDRGARMGAKGRKIICERNDFFLEMGRVETLYSDLVNGSDRGKSNR